MIIFTATHKVTERVFVGNARDDLSLYWEELVSYAENNTPGVFFELLKDGGNSAFDLDEFGYAENPSEARELIQEAREELDAALIKVPKNATRKVATTSSVAVAEVKALLQDLNESDSSSPWEEELTDWSDNDGNQRDSERSKSAPAATSINTSTTTQKKSVLSSGSRLAQARTQSPPARALSPAKQKEEASESISSGKTTSSKKEKRIKEAIEQERESRFEARRRKEREEYEAMRDVCIRIESQRLSNKQSIKRAKELATKRKNRAEKEIAAANKAVTNKQTSPASPRSRASDVANVGGRGMSTDSRSLDLSQDLGAMSQSDVGSVFSAPASPVDPKKAAAQRQREDIKHLLAFIAVKRVELKRSNAVNPTKAQNPTHEPDIKGQASPRFDSSIEQAVKAPNVASIVTKSDVLVKPSSPVEKSVESLVADARPKGSISSDTAATVDIPVTVDVKAESVGAIVPEGRVVPRDQVVPKDQVVSGGQIASEHNAMPAVEPPRSSDEEPMTNESRPKKPQVLNLQSSTNGMLSTESKSIKVMTKRRFGEKNTSTADASESNGFGSRTASPRGGRLSLKRN